MTSGMHILHVFATFDPGGPQVRAAEIMHLLGSSARHTIVAMDGRTGCAERLHGIEHELLDAPPRGGFLGTARAMAGIIREASPDLLLTYNWGAIESLLAARFARFPAVLHHEEGFGREEARRFLRRRVWIRRALLRHAHATIVPSHVLETVALEIWKQPESRVRYLPNGVDLERFRPRKADGAGEHGHGPVVIGNVAHFRPEKNQALLVRAFANCRQRDGARLLFVGDGEELDATRRLAEELGVADRVTFAGPAADTAPLYTEMDIFALSSRTEQMPLVVLEAMASGLPIASTDVGDVREMVDENNRGFVTTKDDPAALAVALDGLISSAVERRRIGLANRERCERHYETRRCLRTHLELYDEAMASRT